MITIQTRQQIKEGKAPFVHYWQFTDPCVQLVKSVITADNIVEATILFRDQSCYDLNKVAQLYVEDATGCKVQYPVILKNPCEGYDFLYNPEIQEVGNMKFRAPVPAKYAPYTFQWTVESAAFFIKEQYNDVVELGVVPGTVLNDGDEILLRVSVTNTYGCCIESTFAITVCSPRITPLSVIPLSCSTPDCPDKQCARISLPVTSCETSNDCNPSFRVPIDWDTFRVEEIPSGLTMELIDKVRKTVLITAPEDYPVDKYIIKYSVADVNGVTAYGEICVQTVFCTGPTFQVQGGTFLIGCKDCKPADRTQLKDVFGPVGYEECSGQNMSIDLESRLVEAKPSEIDWSTFEFMPMQGQVPISKTQMTSDYALITFDPDRKILYAPFSPGQNIFENVRFRLSTKDGREATSTFLFEDDICDAAPIAVDDTYQVREGNTLNVNVTANDKGDFVEAVLVGSGPGPNQGFLSFEKTTGRLTYVATGSQLPDSFMIQYYLVDAQGRVSNTAKINIQINKITVATAAFRSYCPDDASLVDLFDLLDTTDETRYWRFVGKDGVEDGKFAYNGNQPGTYEAGHVFDPRTYVMTVDFSKSSPGIYTFQYKKGHGDAEVSTEISIEIVEPLKMPEQKDILACINSSPFYLENLFDEGELPEGGVWSNITPFGNELTNTRINPPDLGAGVFRYRYLYENQGQYNQVCDSYVDVVVEIANEVYAGEDLCFKVCSSGPDPDTDPDLCRDPRNIINGDAVCEICLWDRMFANPDPKTGDPRIITPYGKWYLKDAPFNTGNILVVNGQIVVVDKGGLIPTGYQPCIDFGNMALGKYEFEYRVSYGCEDSSTITVIVLPQPCQADNVEGIVLELTEGQTKKLLDLLLENLDPAGCLPTIRGYWSQLSGPGSVGIYLDGDGDARNDYIDGGEVVSGTYRFRLDYYPTNIETEYCSETECLDECDACERSVELEVLINPCPDLGDPQGMGVCNSGLSCKMPLQETAPNANYNDPDATYYWKYAGFNSVSPASPNPLETGNIPDVVATRAGGLMWAPGDRIYAVDTSPGPDTDENPIIEWNAATVGYYFFDLVVETPYCVETLRTTVQVVQVPNPGLDGSCLTVCDNREECIELWCLLTGTPGTQGQWTFKGGTDCSGNPIPTIGQAAGPCAGNGVAGNCDPCSERGPLGDPAFFPGIGTTATFNTTGIPCGTYVFEYVSTVPPLSPGFILYACVDGCDPRSAEVTIQILDGDNPGPGGGAAACN